jgi:undecaprenyl-diphosphatase
MNFLYEPSHLAHRLTDFGNITIAVPVLAVMLAWLLRHRLHRTAAALALGAAASVALDIVLRRIAKAQNGFFHGTAWHLTTGAPSGHACVSMVVYGSIGALFVRHAIGATRLLAASLAFAVILAVDITRITLGYHSPADVCTGATLGAVFVLAIHRASDHPPAPWPPMANLLAALLIAGALMQLSGLRFDSNAVL